MQAQLRSCYDAAVFLGLLAQQLPDWEPLFAAFPGVAARMMQGGRMVECLGRTGSEEHECFASGPPQCTQKHVCLFMHVHACARPPAT